MKLPLLVAKWEPDWLYDWQERAAIMEFDGRMERAKAEREAEREIRAMAGASGGRQVSAAGE